MIHFADESASPGIDFRFESHLPLLSHHLDVFSRASLTVLMGLDLLFVQSSRDLTNTRFLVP